MSKGVREARRMRGRGDAVGMGVVAGGLVGALAGVAPALSAEGTAAPALVLLLSTLAGVCLGGILGLLAEGRRPARTIVGTPHPPPPVLDPRLRELEPPEPAVPGWYGDPLGAGLRRYWDGDAWTEHTWRPRPGALPGHDVRYARR